MLVEPGSDLEGSGGTVAVGAALLAGVGVAGGARGPAPLALEGESAKPKPEGRARIHWEASARMTERDPGRVCTGQDSGYVIVNVELNIVFQVGKAARPSASTPGVYWLQNAATGDRGSRTLHLDCPPPISDRSTTVDPAWINSSSASGERRSGARASFTAASTRAQTA